MDNDFSKTHLPFYSVNHGKGEEVTHDLYLWTDQIVNICYFGLKGTRDWVLIDTGMPHSKEAIMKAAEDRFGHKEKPKAILLTHAHFDHVGSLQPLLDEWEDVPVYAHNMELPYLTGEKDYPKPDPSAHGGLVTTLSPLFPNHGISIRGVIPLPSDGSIPYMPGWRWIHTPGHTPGHVSFFREEDRTLIAGDAFVTVHQESLFNVITQKKAISGPPKYFTMNWDDAKTSVRKLQQLHPRKAATGHGECMDGNELLESLDYLVTHFDENAIP